ncbi:MAG: hemolysin family protein [Gemmatimonadales bacterium]|jgi:CBS domain containing-hemolysin-like protein
MITSIVLAVLGLALVLVASAIEVALFTFPLNRVDEASKAHRLGAHHLATLRAQPASLLSALWTLRVTGAALTVPLAWRAARYIAPDSTLALVIAVALAILVLVFIELTGKTLGHNRDDRFCLTTAVPASLIARALWIVTWPAELIARLSAPQFFEIMPGISDREIRDIVAPGNSEPVIEEHERRLIQRAFLLDQTTAYDVMTPRVDMLAWPETRTLAEIASELHHARYSRIPIYSGSVDEVTGVLYVRDAYQALISGQRDVQLKELAREPFFVPGSVTLDNLLIDFQERRIHLGIVIDEYGGVDGLIALEDILEELVGEIVDETDIAAEPIVRLGKNEILVDGSADLREINHFFNTTFPLLEHRSLNGYLLEIFGQVPQPGERITREGVQIEVTAATDTQVLRARLSRQVPRGEVHEAVPDKDEGGEEKQTGRSGAAMPSAGEPTQNSTVEGGARGVVESQ